MLLEIYIIMLVIGIILFILAVAQDAVAYYGINLIIFLVLIGSSFNIEQKFIVATNATNYSIRTVHTTDWSMNAFLIIFVFLDIIMLIMHFVDRSRMNRGDVPYVPR